MIRLTFAACTIFLFFTGLTFAQAPNLSLLPQQEAVAPPPEPVGDPSWAHEETWVDEDWSPWIGWDGSVEFGLNGSSGNSETLNVRAGANFTRKTERNKLAVGMGYNQASDHGTSTKDNAQLNVTNEILFGESPWTLFGKLGVEYDEFKMFDLRLTVNGGVGYQFVKNDVTTLTGRFGAGASREFGGLSDDWTPEAVFGLDLEHQLSKMQKLTAKFEYTPDWSDFADYRATADIGWVIALDDPQNLSLKLSINDQYDSTPNGSEENDLNYSALLLWKF